MEVGEEGEGKRKEKKGAADAQISGLGSKEMDSWSTKMPDFHRAKTFFRKKNLQPHVCQLPRSRECGWME